MKKLILSFYITLIALLTASTALSVAWFNTNDFLQIDTVNINFNVDESLSISTQLDGEYKQSISTDELKDIGAFIPVSSMFSKEWLDKKEKFPTFCGSYERRASTFIDSETDHPYVEPQRTVANEGYFSQEFFLKSDGYFNVTLNCENTNSFLIANTEKNKSVAKEIVKNSESSITEDEILSNLNKVAGAMRVSILVDSDDKYQYYVYDPNKNNETYFGGMIDSDYSGTYDTKVDSNRKRYEVLYGDVLNKDKIIYEYNKDEVKQEKPTSLSSGHAADTYIINKEASIDNGVVIAKENAISFEESETLRKNLLNGKTTNVKDRLLLIPIEPGKPVRIVVSIYLEGWDLDCVNYTMSASFMCRLSFGLLDSAII